MLPFAPQKSWGIAHDGIFCFLLETLKDPARGRKHSTHSLSRTGYSKGLKFVVNAQTTVYWAQQGAPCWIQGRLCLLCFWKRQNWIWIRLNKCLNLIFFTGSTFLNHTNFYSLTSFFAAHFHRSPNIYLPLHRWAVVIWWTMSRGWDFSGMTLLTFWQFSRRSTYWAVYVSRRPLILQEPLWRDH